MKTRFLVAISLFLASNVSAETIQYYCYGPDGATQLDHVDGNTVYYKHGKKTGWLRPDTAPRPKHYPNGFVMHSGMFYENPKAPARAWNAHVSENILMHKSEGMFVFGIKKHYCERR